jgi:hypothetical protein
LPDDPANNFYYYPFGFSVAGDGSFWVPQPNSGNVIHVDSSGHLIQSYFVGNVPEDAVVRPSDGQIFIDEYLASSGTTQIVQLDPSTGNVTTFLTSPPYLAEATAFDPSSNLWVGDFFVGPEVYDTSGNLINSISDYGVFQTQVDPNGNIWDSNVFGVAHRWDGSGNLQFQTSLSGVPLGLTVIGTDGPPPTTPPDTVDYYSFTLSKGQLATIAATGVTGGHVQISLLDGNGNVLATGTSAQTVDQVIANFAAPKGGRYYIEVTGDIGVHYSLVVTRSATFSTVQNNDQSAPQDITHTTGVLGALVPNGGVAVETNFDGLSFSDTSCGCIPPDTIAAVGDGYVVEAINTTIAIYDESGNPLALQQFSDFFAPLGSSIGFYSDPYVEYDAGAGRWYVSLLDIAGDQSHSDLLFAVSNDANPLDGFSLQDRIEIGSNDLLDFDKFGYNADAIVAEANDFNAQGGNPVVIAIDKNALLTSGTWTYYVSYPKPDFRAMVPAQMHGDTAGTTMYFIEENGYENGSSILAVTMTNILSNSPNYVYTPISVDPYGAPPPAAQPGGSSVTNDTTFTQLDWRNGLMVTDQTVSVPDDNYATARVRWYELSTTGPSPSLVQQGTIDAGPGVSTYFGSIAINNAGDLGMTYMQSSASQYISMVITGQPAGSPAGTMSPGTVVAAGLGFNYYSQFRNGDYSGISVDPSDGTTFWAANEYSGTDPIYNTAIAAFQVVQPQPANWYSTTLSAGSTITLTTSTPSDGPGIFGNTLDPHIELFDPNGNLVAQGTKLGDGRNEQLVYNATLSGPYEIVIVAQNGTHGEFFLAQAVASGGGAAAQAAPSAVAATSHAPALQVPQTLSTTKPLAVTAAAPARSAAPGAVTAQGPAPARPIAVSTPVKTPATITIAGITSAKPIPVHYAANSQASPDPVPLIDATLSDLQNLFLGQLDDLFKLVAKNRVAVKTPRD